VALGGAVAVLALLAGPAGAQTTTTVFPPNIPAGSTAIDNSVSSGTAFAQRNSTASGDAVAVDNSTASGCADAARNSTASGDDCGPTTTVRGATTTTRATTPPGGGGGGGALMPLRVTIETAFVPVWPTASRALTVSVCVPSPTTVVSNVNEIGPALLLVVLPAARPSSVAVSVFEAPDVPSIHTVAQVAGPLTVAPGVGCVIHTCRPPPPEIVNVRPFDVPPPGFITVTVAEPAVATSVALMAAVS
jgi:hypothetical protein